MYYIHTSLADPELLAKVQVDKGAIRFILSGANVMCPGLTSPGARMDTPLPADTIVVCLFICGCDVQLYSLATTGSDG